MFNKGKTTLKLPPLGVGFYELQRRQRGGPFGKVFGGLRSRNLPWPNNLISCINDSAVRALEVARIMLFDSSCVLPPTVLFCAKLVSFFEKYGDHLDGEPPRYGPFE